MAASACCSEMILNSSSKVLTCKLKSVSRPPVPRAWAVHNQVLHSDRSGATVGSRQSSKLLIRLRMVGA